MTARFYIFVVFLLAALLAAPGSLRARPRKLLVAAAANFIRPMEEIITIYEARSGVTVETSFASTGKLYAQIRAGAPFDLFLAADAARPWLLFEEGLAAEPHVYARGRAVLWSRRPELAALASWQDVVTADRVSQVAIPSPDVAPYGQAAAAALKAAGMWPRISARLVYGQSVAQAFQFGQGGTEAAFTALSLALSPEGRKGRHWPIPEAPPVIQKGCVLKRSEAGAEARRFFSFLLQNEKARAVMRAYGYE